MSALAGNSHAPMGNITFSEQNGLVFLSLNHTRDVSQKISMLFYHFLKSFNHISAIRTARTTLWAASPFTSLTPGYKGDKRDCILSVSTIVTQTAMQRNPACVQRLLGGSLQVLMLSDFCQLTEAEGTHTELQVWQEAPIMGFCQTQPQSEGHSHYNTAPHSRQQENYWTTETSACCLAALGNEVALMHMLKKKKRYCK